jgi:hypothetical protein
VTDKALLLPIALLLYSCGAESDNQTERVSAREPVQRGQLPRGDEIAAACYASPDKMMMEEARLAGEGVFIEPTFEEFIVRKADCGWRPGQRDNAVCGFEHASIPLGSQQPPARERYLARLREGDWRKTEAVLSPASPAGWICQLKLRPEAGG